MTILSQVLLGFAAIALLIFSVRLIFTLLLRLQLLPVLIWLCVGRVYPQWAAAHPFVFYGVLSLFGLLALSCWLRPLVEWLQETQKARLAERLILDELHRTAVEGRTISGFQVKTVSPSRNMRNEKSGLRPAFSCLIIRTSPLRCAPRLSQGPPAPAY